MSRRKNDNGSCGVFFILICIIASIAEIIKKNYMLILIIMAVIIASYIAYRIIKSEQPETEVVNSKPIIRGYPRYSGQYICDRDIKEGLYDICILEGSGNVEVDGPIKFQKRMSEGQTFNNIEIHIGSTVKIELGMKVDFYNRREVPKLPDLNNEKVENPEEFRESTTDMNELEGHDFEYYCAGILRLNGFENVEVTRGSGDQGVDVIAEKSKVKYAIQCKRYGPPVGNKAVQEVIAGMQYYHCNVGIVMTNSKFTPAAIDLANTTNIILWDGEYIRNNLLNNKSEDISRVVINNNGANMSKREQKGKSYPPGMYIVGVSIEPGGYIIKCRNEKASAEVWKNFESYTDNEPNLICALLCGDDYFITLCKDQFMILSEADIIRYQ